MIKPSEDFGVNAIMKLFVDNGYPIRLVGGAVRDSIFGYFPKDCDFATTATPEQMIKLGEARGWHVIPTGIEHGTVTFMGLPGCFEVTTLRKDVETDGRHAKVEFTDDWKADAERRDFTINAMSMDIDGVVYDYFGGQQDMQDKVLRFVGNAQKRIEEDGLRIIRYFRFGSKFNMKLVDLEDVKANIHNLKNVSVERVWQEINKASHNSESFYLFMRDLMMFEVFEQFGFSFGKGNMNWVKLQQIKVPQFREFAIAVLLQDPAMTTAFIEKFKLSNLEQGALVWFFYYKNKDISINEIEDMLVDGTKREWIIELLNFQGETQELKKVAEEGLRHLFPVKGQDLLDAGMKPGREIGEAIAEMKDAWKASRYKMSKEELLNGRQSKYRTAEWATK